MAEILKFWKILKEVEMYQSTMKHKTLVHMVCQWNLVSKTLVRCYTVVAVV